MVMQAESYRRVEGMLRTACIELGNATGTAGRPLSGEVMKKYAIPNTLSQAWYLGRAVYLARQKKIDFIDAIVSLESHCMDTKLTCRTGRRHSSQTVVYR